jgi:excisionase family DNA binding protein
VLRLLRGDSFLARAREAAGVSERMLTARELAERLGVSTGALLRWTRAGKVPAVKLPSGAVRYRPGELEVWLDAHATAAPGREARTVPTDAADGTVTSRARTVPLRPAAQDEEDPQHAC